MNLARSTALAAAALLVIPAYADGQVKASERSTVAQVVNGTRVEVDYSRPQARGRDPVFGNVVHWGEVWTPGANFATTLTVDQPVRLDGHDLDAGSYSLWLIPREGAWGVVVSDEPRLFHTTRPEQDTRVAEYEITPAEGAHTEVLTFDFPVVQPDHAVLRLRWGTTTLPFRIDVPHWEPYALDPADRPRYLGTFGMTGPHRDPFRVAFWEADGHIQGVWYESPAEAEVVDPAQARGFRFQAVPLGLHRFLMGFYRDGELVGTEPGFLLFLLDDDGATVGLEWRSTGEDGVEFAAASGTRLR